MFLQEAFLRNSSPPLPKSLIKLSLFFKKSWHHSLIQKIAVSARGIVRYRENQFYTVLLLYSKCSNFVNSENIFLLFTLLTVPSKPSLNFFTFQADTVQSSQECTCLFVSRGVRSQVLFDWKHQFCCNSLKLFKVKSNRNMMFECWKTPKMTLTLFTAV